MKISLWILAVFLLALSFILAACNEPPGGNLAKINEVEVVAEPGNSPRYVAVASGILPDGCTRLGRAGQRAR